MINGEYLNLINILVGQMNMLNRKKIDITRDKLKKKIRNAV
jgi:hypothetical protein